MEVTDSDDSLHNGNDFIRSCLTAIIIWIKACISSCVTPTGKMGFEGKKQHERTLPFFERAVCCFDGQVSQL